MALAAIVYTIPSMVILAPALNARPSTGMEPAEVISGAQGQTLPLLPPRVGVATWVAGAV